MTSDASEAVRGVRSGDPSTIAPNPLESTGAYIDLVVVCCHAVYLGEPCPHSDPYEPNKWNLQHFQAPSGSKPGEHETFLKHITTALDFLSSPSTPNCIVVFSGGVTASKVTSLSEARSYYHAGLALGGAYAAISKSLFGKRLFLEEYATDSFQNLLFSIVKFRKTAGRYPRNIVVITHSFKAERFLSLHAPAIRWPWDRIRVVGLDPQFSSATERSDTIEGEKKRGFYPFESDLYGTGSFLMGKRKQRGWHTSSLVDIKSGIEANVQKLLEWDGGQDGTEIFGGDLPWN